MTHSKPTNPKQEDPAAGQPDASKTPGKALLYVRLTLALGVTVGVCVFGIHAINTLSKTSAAPPPPREFGTHTEQVRKQPGPTKIDTDSLSKAFTDLGKINPGQIKPIKTLYPDRANPHPGQFVPFSPLGSEASDPFQTPTVGKEVWEFGTYRSKDSKPIEAFDHYSRVAEERGLKLLTRRAMANHPTGISASWSDGQRTLRLAAWPLPSTRKVRPPLLPPTPLQWVVKYSYLKD